ncbi:MAG: acyl-ACP--UDP-N-acetylglucosamine O-acyltransferase [Deltaproteobacteria bacterium]|nr:acyl-ACP--UDP-N-acetylglucosamine O-acyltransferase [Deltaproteobacteria bacterium]MCX7953216.1 acyl-ACP--UDP-N-acetylglucosamine O-acyltransferase [Deltaproteobacteria bacterium]
MEVKIHQTSVVEPSVELGNGVEIGPFCYLSGNVKISDRVKLLNNVCVTGNTEIGSDCVIFPFACIGYVPQDLKYRGEESRILIGKNNIIREYVTVHPGTEKGGMLTKIGDGNLLMVSTHVAHDCRIGNANVIANYVGLAGHVVIENNVVIGGLVGVHQYVRIGSFAFIAGGSMVRQDVPPFVSVCGNSARAYGINSIGLTRAGFTQNELAFLRKLFRVFFKSKFAFEERIKLVEELIDHKLERQDFLKSLFLEFVKGSSRGVVKYASDQGEESD